MTTLLLHQYALPLRREFTISRGSLRVQQTLVVELQEDGLSGYGAATANSYYGVTVDGMARALRAVQPHVERQSVDDPAALWQALQPWLQEHPFAQCALDEAAWDLWGKKQGQPLYRLWGLTAERLPPSSYTISIDQIDAMVRQLHEMPGWPVYKIKLGTPQDLEIVRQLRRHTDAALRVDANCGWQAEQTIQYAGKLQQWGVEFIEQPLPADRWDAMRRVYERSVLPLIADESCVGEADVDRCRDCFHGINIKLVKCGGLTPARRMIARARHLGLSVMVGCMTESTVGISAAAQLLPLVDYADLDGAVLLAQDIASGATFQQGQCRYADQNGNGVRVAGSG